MMPVAGGLYDQHPDLVDRFWVIIQAQAKSEADKQKPQTKGSKTPARSSSPRRRGRR